METTKIGQKNVKQEYTSLEEFLNHWNKADQKQVVIKELQDKYKLQTK